MRRSSFRVGGGRGMMGRRASGMGARMAPQERVIEKQYHFLRRIGGGSFGDVYLASPRTDRTKMVAIKVMKRIFSSWDECRKLREVKSLMALNHHPCVVQLKTLELDTDKRLYFIFEFLPSNVYKLMQKGPPDVPTIRRLMRQLLDGLGHMHAVGFFHRDVKPENLLLSEDGNLKIADFGEAREVRARPPFTEGVGTRWYMAPELILHSVRYNSPVDMWACGCVLAELMTGGIPLFAGQTELDMLRLMCTVLGPPSKDDWPTGHRLALTRRITFPMVCTAEMATRDQFASPSPVHTTKQTRRQSLRDMFPLCPEPLMELLEAMLQWNPMRRPKAKQALAFRFFTEAADDAEATADDEAKAAAADTASAKHATELAASGKIGGASGNDAVGAVDAGDEAEGRALLRVPSASGSVRDELDWDVGADVGGSAPGDRPRRRSVDSDLESLISEVMGDIDDLGPGPEDIASRRLLGDAAVDMVDASRGGEGKGDDEAGAGASSGPGVASPPAPAPTLARQPSAEELLANILHDLSGDESSVDGGTPAAAQHAHGAADTAAVTETAVLAFAEAEANLVSKPGGAGGDPTSALASGPIAGDGGDGGDRGGDEVVGMAVGEDAARMHLLESLPASPKGGLSDSGAAAAAAAAEYLVDLDDDEGTTAVAGVASGGEAGPSFAEARPDAPRVGVEVSGVGAGTFRPPTPPPASAPRLVSYHSDVRVQIHTPEVVPRTGASAQAVLGLTPTRGGLCDLTGLPPSRGSAMSAATAEGGALPARLGSALGVGDDARALAASTDAGGDAGAGTVPADLADGAGGDGGASMPPPMLAMTRQSSQMVPDEAEAEAAEREAAAIRSAKLKTAVQALSHKELVYLVGKMMDRVVGAEDLATRYFAARKRKRRRSKRRAGGHRRRHGGAAGKQGSGGGGGDGRGAPITPGEAPDFGASGLTRSIARTPQGPPPPTPSTPLTPVTPLHPSPPGTGSVARSRSSHLHGHAYGRPRVHHSAAELRSRGSAMEASVDEHLTAIPPRPPGSRP